MTSHGIVYVATQQDRYIEEAFLSAESVKRQTPGMHITLFTDRPGNPLCGMGLFDAVEPIEGGGLKDPRANAQVNRILCLARTPYERSLYLDTDARVLSPAVPALFDKLDAYDVALVEDAADSSNARTWSRLRMFNCGVILYQNGDRFSAVLRQWETRTRRNLALARETPLPAVPELAHVPDETVRRKLLEIDKMALWGVLPPDVPQTNARVLTLDDSWNYRKAPGAKTVNILHLHDRIGTPSEELRDLAYAWGKAGQNSAAQRLMDYLAVL
ncbi:MAG: hypothetical protein ACYCZX_03995 [Rhodospirillaceae bacterium]